MALPQHPLTLDEFLALPEEKPALEYVDGRVRQKVSPKLPHGFLQAHLVKYFDAAGMPGKVARATTETRFTFAGQGRVPDVAVLRWARVPRDRRGRVAADCPYPPDIAVEILSPGQSIAELTRDCAWYVANGVALALLVIPLGERVRRFLPGQPWRELRGDEEIDFGAVIPGARLRGRELFSALDVD